MGLFDLFSNKSAEEAARKANAGLQAGYTQLSDLYGQGRNAITSGYGKAEGVLSDVLGAYKPGAAAYGDATGAGGVEGLQRATDLFKNSGQYGVYGFARDQGQQAIERAHAAAGNLSSGNTDTDTAKFTEGLAGQNWGQFVSGLQPYLSGYGTAGSNLGNAYVGEAGALDTSFRGQGGAANTSETAQGANLAGAELNNYKVGANQLNALLGVGQLALGMPPTSFSGIGGGSGGGGGGTPVGQTPGQPFNWGATPIAQAGKSLFSAFT